MKLPVILLWKGISAPVSPLLKEQGQYPVISALSGVPEITYDAVK